MKFKRSIILLFLILAYFLVYLAIKFGFNNFEKRWGLIIGLVLMFMSIPIHLLGKKKHFFYLCSYLINSIAIGFSISTYYHYKDINPSEKQFLFVCLISLGIILITSLLTLPKIIKPYAKLIVSLEILILFIMSIVLWVINDTIIYSLLFYYLNITYFYMVCIITSSINIKQLIKKISIVSFGAFIVISIIVLILISEGEAIEGIGEALGEALVEEVSHKITRKNKNLYK